MSAAPSAAKNSPAAEMLSAEERLEKVELLWSEERARNQRQLADINAETAQLKETINALRDSMEQARVGEQERIQRAVATTEDELRDQLEMQKAGETERTQKAVADANAEIVQLKAAINALRDELERQKVGENERTQKALAHATAENVQLKGSIDALRSQLDAEQAAAHA